MVNVSGGPGQPLAEGVTVMVAVTDVLPLFTAVNAGMFPLPLAANPMEVLLFVQLNWVLATEPVKLMALVTVPSHTDWLAGCATSGDGFTVMVNVLGVPAQVRCTGVTVMVAVTGALPVLIAVKDAMLPVPLAGSPMDGLLFVQLYTVFGNGPEKLTALVDAPAHKV